MIKYLKHNEIESEKWDRCLENIVKPYFYVLFDFLTAIALWDAIVLENDEGDYVGIMPLPFKKKLGVKYLYQPYFCQQFGYLSNELLSEDQVKMISKLIKSKFLFGSAQWIDLDVFTPFFLHEKRKNYELILVNSYDQLQQKFNTNRKRVIKKLEKNGYLIKSNSEISAIEDCVINVKNEIGDRFPQVSSQNYQNLFQGLKKLSNRTKISIISVYNSETLMCQSLFIEYKDRIVYLLGYTKKEFGSLGVSTLTFTKIMESEHQTGKILDLEGGNLPGIEKFYQSFGAQKKEFNYVKIRPVWFELAKIVR